MFPEAVQKAMHELMDSTKAYTNFIVNFAMAYGGRAEIIDATKKIAEQVKQGKLNIDEINEEVFKKNGHRRTFEKWQELQNEFGYR